MSMKDKLAAFSQTKTGKAAEALAAGVSVGATTTSGTGVLAAATVGAILAVGEKKGKKDK